MTYEEALALSAALLNDTARDVYTDEVMLPYLNMTLMELQEIFELNNIPVTNETSAAITIPEGDSILGFETTPALPSDLVEIRQLFESRVDQNLWVPVSKQEYLTPSNPGNVELSYFGVWAWQEQEIRLFPLINDQDLRIDYIRSIFNFLELVDLTEDITVINAGSFIFNRTASFIAKFVMHDDARSETLNGQAGAALDRSLGISIKSKQSIFTRRRPFRAAFKRRRNNY
jgi:hypothetical protein